MQPHGAVSINIETVDRRPSFALMLAWQYIVNRPLDKSNASSDVVSSGRRMALDILTGSSNSLAKASESKPLFTRYGGLRGLSATGQ